VGNGSGLSRGDRNRNARLARLRELVPLSNAIVGIDLADGAQAAVVTDHDSRVIARRRVSARAWELGELLDWAVARAAGAGFASVTVACEPTGHRWRVLDQLAAGRGLALVCVQPLLVYRAREGEDLTRDKSDPKDAVLIARLASELRCYEPERASAMWARLRHLGARRAQLTTGATAAVNQIRDLAECAWPAVLTASGSPFRSVTWCASLAVVLDRCAGDLARVRRLGPDRFTAAVRRELPRWGGIRPRLRIIRAVFAALADPAGVTAHRPGEGDGPGGPVDAGPGRAWLPSCPAVAGLIRGPVALANSLPMTVPGSVPVPIMVPGRVPPRIQPGLPVPPVIHWYPARLIIQPPPDPPIIVRRSSRPSWTGTRSNPGRRRPPGWLAGHAACRMTGGRNTAQRHAGLPAGPGGGCCRPLAAHSAGGDEGAFRVRIRTGWPGWHCGTPPDRYRCA